MYFPNVTSLNFTLDSQIDIITDEELKKILRTHLLRLSDAKLMDASYHSFIEDYEVIEQDKPARFGIVQGHSFDPLFYKGIELIKPGIYTKEQIVEFMLTRNSNPRMYNAHLYNSLMFNRPDIGKSFVVPLYGDKYVRVIVNEGAVEHTGRNEDEVYDPS